MPQPVITLDSLACDVRSAYGSISSSEISVGDIFWSITASAATPENADINSGTGALRSGTYPKNGSSPQSFYGLPNLTLVTVDTTLYMHAYHAHPDGDSVAVTRSFTQLHSITVSGLVVSAGAGGLNLACNFDHDIGGDGTYATFYIVIDTVANITGLYGSNVRNGQNKNYGAALYASGAIPLGPGTSFSLSDFDQAAISEALTDGETYAVGVSFVDSRGAVYNGLPGSPALTAQFVADFSPVGPTVDSVNNGLDVIAVSGAYSRLDFAYSGFESDPTSVRIYDSFGGVHNSTSFSIDYVSTGEASWPLLNLRLEQRGYREAREGIAFTAPNNIVTFELTNGAETASIVVNYLPMEGRAVTELRTPLNTGPGSVVGEFTDVVLDLDQVYYPADTATVATDGIYEVDTAEGTTVYFAVYDQTDHFWKPHAISFPSSVPASFGGFGPTVDEVLNSSFLHYSPIYTIDNMSTALMITPEPGKSRLQINSGQLLDEPQLLYPGDEFRFYVRLDGYNSFQTNTVNIESLGDFTSSLQTDSPVYDFEPDAFTFTDVVTNAEGVEYTASMTVSGLDGTTSVSIDKYSEFVAGFSINGTRFPQTTGRFVDNGDVIDVHVTSGADGSTNSIGVHVGGITNTFSVVMVDNPIPTLTLLGDDPGETIQGFAYIDPGATAADILDGDITPLIFSTGSVDESTIGEYTLTYSVTNSSLQNAEITRTVNVLAPDIVPDPFNFTSSTGVAISQLYISSQITVQGVTPGAAVPISVTGGEYNIAGGSFTVSAGTVLGSQAVRLRVLSSALPIDTVTATVTIGGVQGSYTVTTAPDILSPVISLLGDNPVEIVRGGIYSEPGYSALDNIDGDVTSEVVVTGTIDLDAPGSYVLTYTATDSSSNVSSVQRVISVISNVVSESEITNFVFVEGDPIAIDVTPHFSGADTYVVDVSPEELGLSISDLGIVSGSAVVGIHRAVVIGSSGSSSARSNVFEIEVSPELVGVIPGEPVEATIVIDPAQNDGLRNTLYDDNTNAIVITGIMGQISRQPISSPAITGSIRRADDSPIQTLTFETFADGYFATVSDDDFSDAVLHVNITSGGALGDWKIPLAWTNRVL